MHVRAVIVTIAPGQTEAYWAWAREILDLWDSAGIQRCGGPYRARGGDGADMGVWLTLHESEEAAQEQFRALYSDGPGRALIERRPALVAHTESRVLAPWDLAGDPPEWIALAG